MTKISVAGSGVPDSPLTVTSRLPAEAELSHAENSAITIDRPQRIVGCV